MYVWDVGCENVYFDNSFEFLLLIIIKTGMEG